MALFKISRTGTDSWHFFAGASSDQRRRCCLALSGVGGDAEGVLAGISDLNLRLTHRMLLPANASVFADGERSRQ